MSAALQIATTLYSTYQTSKVQRQAGEDERAARNMQAEALDAQAAQVERKGISEEAVSRARLKKLMSSQRALYAKAGVDLSSGSPLTVLAATAYEGDKEAAGIRLNTQEESQGIRSGADLQRFYGRQASKAGRTRAKSTLLSGLTSAVSKGYSAYGSYKSGN